jgi:hypothetical protein
MTVREHTQRGTDMMAARLIRRSEARRVWEQEQIAAARAAWGELPEPDPSDRRRRFKLIPGELPADAVVDRAEHLEAMRAWSQLVAS